MTNVITSESESVSECICHKITKEFVISVRLINGSLQIFYGGFGIIPWKVLQMGRYFFVKCGDLVTGMRKRGKNRVPNAW